MPAISEIEGIGAVTAERLKQIESSLKTHGIPIQDRRGRTAIYFSDPNGYQLECYCN